MKSLSILKIHAYSLLGVLLLGGAALDVSAQHARGFRGVWNDWGYDAMSLDLGVWRATVEASGSDHRFKIAHDNWNYEWTHGGSLAMASIQDAFTGGGDTEIAATAGRHYTFAMNNVDSWQQGLMIVQETENPPIDVTAVSHSFSGRDAVISITTSGTPSPGEKIYVRYSMDSWSSSDFVEATGSGTTWSATIEHDEQDEDESVGYYVLTTTVSTPTSSDANLQTIRWNNNGGPNYDYIVPEDVPLPPVAPSVQVSGLQFTNVSSTSLTVTWTPGDGARRMVAVREGGPVDATPADGNWYDPDSAFGEGDEMGAGNFSVYVGDGSSVSVSGLSPTTTYHFQAFEFNGNFTGRVYNTSTATGNPASVTTLETPPMVIRINEIMASNGNTIADEDGDFEDWVELYNAGSDPVDLEGWGLSDDESNPFKWIFGAVTIDPGEYLLVWASGKDRPTGPHLHTSWSISSSGEEILLTMPDGTEMDFVPPIPIPRDISYGRTLADPSVFTLFSDPTPGAVNAGPSGQFLTEEVTFSEPSRTFTHTENSVTVSLGGEASGQEIRYTTDGSIPTASSTLYTGPLNLSQTTLLRARIFDPSGSGSLVATRHYLRLSPTLSDKRSNLPMIVMDARGQEIEKIETVNGTLRQDGYFFLFDRQGSNPSELAAMPNIATRQGVRLRGSSSLLQDKKPYAIEFWSEIDYDEVDIEVLGMAPDSDWVLYAPYNFDRAFIRNTVMYELSRQIGRWAGDSRMVEVYVNHNGDTLSSGDYMGVYAIIERSKQGDHRLGIDNVGRDEVPPDGPIDVMAEGDWTGGYQIKIDRAALDEVFWDTSRGIPPLDAGNRLGWLTLSRPKLYRLDGGDHASAGDPQQSAKNDSRQYAYISSYIQAFEDALWADYSNGFTTRSYTNFIDRQTWVDHLLLNVFAKNVDALRLSAFMYKPQNDLLRAGPIWDFDRSMGSYDWRDSNPFSWYGSGDATKYFEYGWWDWLTADPDFAQAFYDRWAEWRQGAFTATNLNALIYGLGNEVNNSANGAGSAAARDAAQWPANTGPRDGNYMNEIDDLYDWVIDRANWMDGRRMSTGLLPDSPSISVNGDQVTITGPSGGGSSASDTASNYSDWLNGSNEGSGFGNWALSRTIENNDLAGHFLSGSGNGWGLYANSGAQAEAFRPFGSAMVVGQTFSLRFQNDAIQSGGSVGFALHNASGEELLYFSFLGGETHYVINDVSTGVGFTADGLDVTIELTGTGTFSATVNPVNGSPEVLSGSLQNPAGGQAIAEFRVWNSNAGNDNDLLIDNLEISGATGGTVYYTTDGSDPRASGGGIAGTEYTGTFSFSGHGVVTARTRAADGSWSPPVMMEVGEPPEPPELTLVHYWNFNDTTDLLSPTYSLKAGAGIAIDTGTVSVVTSGTGQDFAAENARFDDEAGAHLRLNNPIGATMDIALPTQGFEDVVVRYETRRSGSGAGTQDVEYTLDGSSYTFFTSYDVTTTPTVQELDFSAITGANENADFGIRITFAMGAGGDVGNNRFDNLTLEGVATGAINLPPDVENPISHQELIAQAAPIQINLNTVFNDPDGDPLTFGAEASDEAVATADVSGDTLTITPLSRGGTPVTVTADDGNNPEVTTQFYVLVYPEAHDLEAAFYTFSEWAATNVAGAFPPHMVFLQSDRDDTEIDTDLLFAYHIPADDAGNPPDTDFPYDASNRTRMNGLGEDGVAFINTGRGRDLGGALLALDTRNVTEVPVTWLGGTVLANNREYAIRLQYRVGASGAWSDMLDGNGDPVVYERNVDGHSEVLGPVLLPPEALDEEYVQLLWRYYWADPEGVTGSRAQLRIDEIEVANSAAAPAEVLEFAVEPPSAWQSGVELPSITVQAVDGEGQVDLNFDGQVTIALQGDGSLSGSTQVTAVDGVAMFDALTITGTGSAQLQATASGVDPALSDPVALAAVTGVVVPQYMQGEQDLFGDNNDRVPFAFRAEIEGLLPNATYRYGNRVVVSADPATDNGAGNMIFVTGDSSDWIRNTSSPRFRDTDFEGRHFEFTTDGSGSYTGWFITEPSGNARFTPGNTVNLRIMLNDGQNGEDPVWYLTLSDQVSVIRFGTAINEATAIMGDAADPARNFVFLYDHTSGSGRPLAGAPIEITGSVVDDRYAAYYETIVAVSDDFWGTLIPNDLANGVRRIETRALATGAVLTADEYPTGVDDTINPTSGLDPITVGAVNLPPVVVVPVGLQTAIAESDVFPVSVAGVFDDPEDDPLTFAASSDTLGVATVSVDGDNVHVTPVGQGQAIITVTADDGVNTPVPSTFRVLVYPAAHELENGRYEFNEWAATNAAGSFPPHMLFLQSDRNDTLIDTELLFAYHIPSGDEGNAADVDFPYNASSRTRINGLGEDGIAFINTGRGRDLGGALLALDTRNVSEAPVAWLGGTVLANNREYAIRLQYRVGATGPWIDVLDDSDQPVEYPRNAADGHFQTMGPVELPAAALDQEYVQLLWRYYWTDPEGATGSRAQLRLDDIVVANSAVLPASALEFEVEPAAFWQSGQALLPITVKAVDANGLVDTEFDDLITLAAVGDAVLTGDLSIPAVDGVASFTNVVLTGLGTNRLSASSGSLTAAQSDEIALSDVTGILVPLFMQGEQDASDNNEDRIPYAFRAQIDGLLPNATYRYGNRVITQDDPWDQNGAGNSIFVTGSASDWIRNTSAPRFRDTDFEGRHYEFTTDSSGSYTGWFVTEPSGNDRFTPGNTVHLRILLNDGQDGEDEQHYLTLAEEVTVIRFGDQPNEATGIMGESAEAARHFVFLYDETAGTSRPLAGVPIEITGSTVDDRYADFYDQVVATTPQFWGTLIPNTLPTGVRRIEARSVIDGSILSSDTSASGIPETINPAAGLNAILLDADDEIAIFLPGDSQDWTSDANWTTATYPDGTNVKALINAPVGGNRNVNIREPVTIGELTVNNTNTSFRNRIRDRDSGNTLSFASSSGPARLIITGSGTGFVEFENEAGAVLTSDLRITVDHMEGDPEHGALRLRESWTGFGGLIKDGAGVMSLTGGGKDYTGATSIDFGVLRVTEPATPAATAGVTVNPGGQLRLVSGGEDPRVYSFGGSLTLNSEGRGGDVPVGEEEGILGGLRYDPDSNDNSAEVTNDILLAGPSSMHVDGTRNLMELSGSLSGTGTVSKSGGGILVLSGDSVGYAAPISVTTGELRIEGVISSDVTLSADTVLRGTGRLGAIQTSGAATVAAGPGVGALTASAVGAASHMIRLSDEGSSLIRLTDVTPFTATLNPANSIQVFVDAAEITTDMVFEAGLFTDEDADFLASIENASWTFYVLDESGSIEFDGQTYSVSSTTLPRETVAAERDFGDGPVSGRILRFGEADVPAGFAAWQDAEFTEAELADPAISGPLADPDDSGIPNLLRYALGLGRTDAFDEALPQGQSMVAGGVLRHRRLVDEESGISYVLWVSDELDSESWQEVVMGTDLVEIGTEPTGDGITEVVAYEVPEGTLEGTARYFRLQVVLDGEAE